MKINTKSSQLFDTSFYPQMVHMHSLACTS